VQTVGGVEVRLFENILDRIFRKHGELRNLVRVGARELDEELEIHISFGTLHSPPQ
jgi:hypothetical protein